MGPERPGLADCWLPKLPTLVAYRMKLRLPWPGIGMVVDNNHRNVPAGVVRLEGLNQRKAAMTSCHKVNKDDRRRRFSGLTESCGFILSYEHDVAVAFEARLISAPRRRLVID